jgi:hypothetical protein
MKRKISTRLACEIVSYGKLEINIFFYIFFICDRIMSTIKQLFFVFY